MHFHWLRCRSAQGQFCYYWRPGTQNLADYFTKHHPTSHHKSVRPTILTPANDPKYTKLFKTTTTPVTFEPQINIGINKIICQESTPNTKVQDQNHQHSHSKKVPKNSYGKGVLDLQISTYLRDGMNCQISSNSCQSYDAP